jgi:tetratricopeptide (TPR) repeat protein
LAGLRATPPLERVTTGSLDAFNKYSQARVAALSGDPNRAAGLLREAVAIDADFAMAWRMLAAVLNDTGSRGQAERNEALTRAFELGDRLTDRERYLIEGDYYRSVVDDPAAAARAYDNLLDLYPSDFGGLVNRSVVAEDTRDWALGVELMERALALDSTIVNFYARLAHLHVNRGELEAADALMERMGRNLPGHPAILDLTADIAVARGDLRAAVQPVDDLAASYPGPRFVLKRMALAGAVGRLDDAERDRRTLEDMFAGAGAPSEALRVSLGRALQEAIVRGNPAGAARVIDEALDRYPLDQMAPMDRPYVTAGGPPLVQALALAGETERARALLEEYRRVAPEDQYEEIDARRGMRHVLISEGRYDEALEDLRGPTDNCVYCDLVEYARAYEGAGPPDSAAAAWARLADVPWWAKLNWDQFWLGPALERAAQLYDQLGDLERAAEYYARLVEVWAEADPDLQPRVLAAQARLQQLFEEIG